MEVKEEVNLLEKQIVLERLLGSFRGEEKAPTVIFFGGIHGNERAGIIALSKVVQEIKKRNLQFKGNFYALAGNTHALKENVRFKNVDLNRIWTKEKIAKILHKSKKNSEETELASIYSHIKEIVSKNKGPFYFIDLHTTSSETQPFITISDSLNNRKFSKAFSIPTILGIEEFLDGPLLTFINEFGHVALGFEAGQHFKESSVDNCIAFIWSVLKVSGCLDFEQNNLNNTHKKYLDRLNYLQEFYEIDYKYAIDKLEDFKMIEGFKNFEKIKKHQNLAYSNNQPIKSHLNGEIFMPLYQQQGDDGFFIITKISRFWLRLSRYARTLQLHNLLRILPGVKRAKTNKYTFIVNPKTAKFLATEIFHLFGFRKKYVKNNRMYFVRRDREFSEFI